jgi:UDP-4-amino-4-deoxy-L-arabinose formyltransferase/UDP-glucuronic acid dehydrogenase (UDP-4-keto-hexauronic acid decarboxylating)
MTRFVVAGEGWPARAFLERAVAARGATVDALILEHPTRNPLAELAQRQDIAVVDKSDLAVACRDLTCGPERWLISINSTVIIPTAVLEMFQGRSLNFHPGLLPEYAGLHTHQWAIRNGEREFGVTVHRMEERLDAGAIVAQTRLAIMPEDTGLSLFRRCLAAGIELFSRVAAQILRGESLIEVPQDLTRRRLYRHRDALDGRISWEGSATRVIDFIRAGNYEPFTSPSYVARLDNAAGCEIEVLRGIEEGSTDEPPGTILDVSPAGPRVTCGDGTTIRIVRARHRRQLMSYETWHDYLSQLPGHRLQGRREPFPVPLHAPVTTRVI